jgi:radical SAM protein with 4Fe4S-binding SPASM domain
VVSASKVFSTPFDLLEVSRRPRAMIPNPLRAAWTSWSRTRIGRRAAANEELLRREMAERCPIVRSHPVTLILEPATACNLRCPFCPTGGGFTKLPREVLTPGTFERILTHLRVELLRNVALYNWGEPFLNRHTLDFVSYFHERNKITLISSNLSVRDYDAEFFDRLVGSGLDLLIASIDGASQESYEKYRVGGSYQRILRNLRGLAERKRRLGSPHPRVFYKMLLHRFNQHEVDEARRAAESAECEFVLDLSFGCPDAVRDSWIADSIREEYGTAIPPIAGFTEPLDPTMSTHCHQLWDSIVVNADGAVFPCCLVYDPAQAVGNLVEQDIAEVWNGPRMIELRRFVANPAAPAPTAPNHCAGCSMRLCAQA